jgi:hypothetical protein
VGTPDDSYFDAVAASMRLQLDDEQAAQLRQIVRENAAFLASVESSERIPADDPHDFMRTVRAWMERHGD